MDLYTAALWAVAGFAWGILRLYLRRRADQADAACLSTIQEARAWVRREAVVREDQTAREASALLERHMRKFNEDMERLNAESLRAWRLLFAWYPLTVVGVLALTILSVMRAA